MKITNLVIVLAATTTPAFAEGDDGSNRITGVASPRGYVGVGGLAGVDAVFLAGVSLDGGARLGTSPLYLRGRVEAGRAGTWGGGNGNYQSALLGIEARACAIRACVFAGIDSGARGVQLTHVLDDGMQVHEDYTAGLIVPRAGVDVGGTRIRGRFGVELPTEIAGDRSQTGFAVTAGIGVVF
jgi:hypothetical protein